MGDANFVERIKSRIDEYNDLYKDVYKNYELSAEERLFAEFLDDLWKPRFGDEDKDAKLYENGSIAVLFQSNTDGKDVYRKIFLLRKLHPLRVGNAPLWFVLYKLSKNNDFYNLFLCPNIMYKDRESALTESSVIASNTYFIDIDEIDTPKPPYNMRQSDIAGFFNSSFDVFTDIKPKYILMSGRGFHLYFVLEKTEKLSYYKDPSSIRQVHKWLTKDLIELYGADKVCHNLNRFMRIPYSVNHKINIKTRIYKTDDKGKHNLGEMLSIIKTYKKTCTWNNGKLHSKADVEPDKETKKKNKESSAGYTGNCGISNLCNRRQRDLEKWISLHWKDLKGRRHNFFWIYINNFRNMKSDKSYIAMKANALNKTLLEPLSQKELDQIIESNDKVYRIKNETIAELLNISDEDNKELEGVYTYFEKEVRQQSKEEEKEQKRQERLERNELERLKGWKKYFDYISDNPECTGVQISEHFKISESYSCKIKRAYNKYRDKTG